MEMEDVIFRHLDRRFGSNCNIIRVNDVMNVFKFSYYTVVDDSHVHNREYENYIGEVFGKEYRGLLYKWCMDRYNGDFTIELGIESGYIRLTHTNGVVSSRTKPSIILDYDGINKEIWVLNGQKHREGGPAEVVTYDDGVFGYNEYYLKGNSYQNRSMFEKYLKRYKRVRRFISILKKILGIWKK